MVKALNAPLKVLTEAFLLFPLPAIFFSAAIKLAAKPKFYINSFRLAAEKILIPKYTKEFRVFCLTH